MNREHAELLAELRQAARPTSPERHTTDSYGGSGHPFYNVSAPDQRSIARCWLAARKTITPTAFLAVVESLFEGESHEEKTLAAILLGCLPIGRREARPDDIARWLGLLNGWA